MATPILDIDSPLSLIMKTVDPVNWKYLTTHAITKGDLELKITSQETDCWLCCEKNGKFIDVRARDVHLYDIERAVPMLEDTIHKYIFYLRPNMLMVWVKTDDERQQIHKLENYFFPKEDTRVYTKRYIVKNEYSIFEAYKECKNAGLIVDFNCKIEDPEREIRRLNNK